MRRSELVTVPSFSPQPAAGSRQEDIGKLRGIGLSHTVRNDQRLATGQCLVNPVSVRQADRGVGSHYPEHTDLTPVNRLEQLHGFIDRKSTRLNSSHVRISYAV